MDILVDELRNFKNLNAMFLRHYLIVLMRNDGHESFKELIAPNGFHNWDVL
jgi:hypothetical protein